MLGLVTVLVAKRESVIEMESNSFKARTPQPFIGTRIEISA